MTRIYGDWTKQIINHTKGNTIITGVLNNISATVDTIVDTLCESEIDRYKKLNVDYKITKADITFYEMSILFDVVKSIEKYTKPEDILISVNEEISAKGNIIINAVIERSGIQYNLSTEAIYAGGHNIQTLHFRYITKSKLPKSGDKTITVRISKEIKRLNKIAEYEKGITRYENKIAMHESKLAYNENLTEEEIRVIAKAKAIKEGFLLPWEEIVRRGADENYDYSIEKFKARQEEFLLSKIESWKFWNLNEHRNMITIGKKSISQLNKKLIKLG